MAWRWSQGEQLRRRAAARVWSSYDLATRQLTTLAPGSPEQLPRPATIPASWTWDAGDESTGEPPGWIEPASEAATRRTGYCGLAQSQPPIYSVTPGGIVPQSYSDV